MRLEEKGVLVAPSGLLNQGFVKRESEYLGRFEFKLPRFRVEDALGRNPISGIKLPVGGKMIQVVVEVELSRSRPPFTDLMMGECAAAKFLNLLTVFPDEGKRESISDRSAIN